MFVVNRIAECNAVRINMMDGKSESKVLRCFFPGIYAVDLKLLHFGKVALIYVSVSD